MGCAMVMGSLQCLSVLLLWVIVGQGPAVLQQMRDGAVFIFFNCYFYLSSFLSFISNAPSFGKRTDMSDILWFRLLNRNSSC